MCGNAAGGDSLDCEAPHPADRGVPAPGGGRRGAAHGEGRTVRDPERGAGDGAAPAPLRDFGWAGHPRGLSTLFFTEMWERFSYYGMRAFLILYMTAPAAAGGLAFEVPRAGSVYGTYVGSVWFATIFGGIIADRWLGAYRSVLYGG